MPDIVTSVNYLKGLPLYKVEKPYLVLLPASEDFDPKSARTDNLKFENRDGIKVTDIRGREKEFQLIINGFETMSNTSKLLNFHNMNDVQAYKRETEDILKTKFGAERDFKVSAILLSLLFLLTVYCYLDAKKPHPYQL